MNKAILTGNLGGDPDTRFTPSGLRVCNFNIATNEFWTDKQGQRQQRTEWHRVVAWGRLAELCAQYLTKGRQVYVEGRLRTRKWEDREKIQRQTTEIQAVYVEFLGMPPGQLPRPVASATGDQAPEDYGDNAPPVGSLPKEDLPPISDTDVPY